MEISFDYVTFLETTSSLVFPIELRTEENLAYIGQIATMFNISADNMRILVSKCIDIRKMTFDKERLKTLALKQTNTGSNTSALDYSQSPITFLQAKQNGTMVVPYEKEILLHLMTDLDMPFEVINVMIEYILEISDNRLNRKFVDAVAAGWIRNGIKAKEQALEMAARDRTNRTPSKKTKRVLHIEYELQYKMESEEEWKTTLCTDSLEKVNPARKRLHEIYHSIKTRIIARQVSDYWIVSE